MCPFHFWLKDTDSHIVKHKRDPMKDDKECDDAVAADVVIETNLATLVSECVVKAKTNDKLASSTKTHTISSIQSELTNVHKDLVRYYSNFGIMDTSTPEGLHNLFS
jgi:hypothetical protein